MGVTVGAEVLQSVPGRILRRGVPATGVTVGAVEKGAPVGCGDPVRHVRSNRLRRSASESMTGGVTEPPSASRYLRPRR